MTSVWKRLQRVGKKAAKFQFAASFQELIVECTNKWQPDKLRVVWIRRNRRHSTKLHSWQPGIKNPYRGLVIWQIPESLDINVTLFKEPTAEEFEDKDWTFVIENETKGRRKVLASADVNMKKYASATPAQYDITLKLKPLSVKVVEATLKLSLSCVFLKEGKATDEDMQSLASLMSMKQSDIGNLDDFNDSDEEVGEDRRSSFGTGQATHVTEFKRQLSTLSEEDNLSTTPTTPDPRGLGSQRPELSRVSTRKTDTTFGIKVVKATAGPESMDSLLRLSTRTPLAPGLKQSEIPKTQKDKTKSRQTRTPTSVQPTLPPPYPSKPKQNPDFYDATSASNKDLLVKSHSSQKSIQFGNPVAQQVPVQATPLSPTNSQVMSEYPQEPVLHFPKVSTVADSKLIGGRIGVAQKTEPVFGNERVASSSSFRDSTSAFPPFVMSKTSELQSGVVSTATNPQWENPLRNTLQINLSAPIAFTDKKNISNTAALDQVPSRLDSDIGFLPAQQSATKQRQGPEAYFSTNSTQSYEAVGYLDSKEHCTEEGRKENVAWSKNETPMGQRNVAQECLLRSSGIIIDESCVYISKVELGPLCPKGNSAFPLLSTQIEGTVEAPNMTNLCSSCPQYSKIPGMLSLHPSKDVAWPDDRNVLLQMLPREGLSLIIYSDYTPYFCEGSSETAKMISITPSCPRSASIPGFPSTFRCLESCVSLLAGMSTVLEKELIPSIVNVVPLCPRQTRTPGMPSLHQNSSQNKDWNALRRLIKKSATKSTQAYIVQWTPKEAETSKDMVNMSTSCPQRAQVFGLPSAPRQEPSIVNLLPSCPRHSGIHGLPSKTGKTLGLSRCQEWFTVRGLQRETPVIKREVQILETVLCFDRSDSKRMCAMLPSCPEHATVPGFPSAPMLTVANCPSMVSLLPCCAKESRVPGMPTRKHQEWLMEGKVLLLPSKTSAVVVQLDEVTDSYLDYDMFVNMVSILPSCPRVTCIPGFPSAPRRRLADIPSMISLLPICPRHSSVCGLPSIIYSDDVGGWGVNREPVWEKTSTKPGIFSALHSSKGYFIENALIAIMVSMLPPCPKHSNIPGIPSKDGGRSVKASSMVNSLPTFPKHSKIPGLPAINIAKEFDGNYADRDAIWESAFARRYGVPRQHFNVKKMSYRDKEIMLSMLPSCPQQALNPGFPSAPRPHALVYEKSPDMVEMITCCPRKSGIIGFPSLMPLFCDPKEDWPTVKMMKTHRRLKTTGFLESSSLNVSLSPDFTDQSPNMVNIVPTCPKKSSVLGAPSKHVHLSGVAWPKSGRTTVTEDRKNLTSQQPPPEEQYLCEVSVEEKSIKSVFPGQDEPEDAQHRLTTESPTLAIKDFSEFQADQASFGFNGPELLRDEARPPRLDLDVEETKSDVSSTLEMCKDEQGFWTQTEEDIAALEKGNLHCRMLHSIPDLPLFLTVRKSPVGLKDAEGEVKQMKTTDITVDSRGFVSLDESSKTFSVESRDVMTTAHDTVCEGDTRLSQSG